MSSEQENLSRGELDARARQGEVVVPGGKSLEAQEHRAEGRSRGGQTRKEQLGHEGYHELGAKGGQTRKEQLGKEGYQEMGKKGAVKAPWTRLVENVRQRRGFRLMNPYVSQAAMNIVCRVLCYVDGNCNVSCMEFCEENIILRRLGYSSFYGFSCIGLRLLYGF